MEEIKVTKSLVDDLYEKICDYYATGQSYNLQESMDISKKLETESKIDWLWWNDLATISARRKATTLTLYAVIAMYGVEVVDR